MMKNEQNYITLQQFLKKEGFISSTGASKFFLVENDVQVNGEPENRRGKKLYLNDVVIINDKKFEILI